MGLREKIALVFVAVIIQIVHASSIKGNPFERFSSKQQLKNSGVCYNSGTPSSNPTNSNKVGYPGSSSYSTTKASRKRNFGANPASNNKFDPKLLENFKKEARRKRKNKKLENAYPTPIQMQDNKPFVTNTGAFPEVEYPLTAMDSWSSQYWNTMPYMADDYRTNQNGLSPVTQTCQPRKSKFCPKSAIAKGNKRIAAKNPKEKKNRAVSPNNSVNGNLSKNSKIEAQVPQVKKNVSSNSVNPKITSGVNSPAKLDRLSRRKLKKRLQNDNRKTITKSKPRSRSKQLNKSSYTTCTPNNNKDNINLDNVGSLSSNTSKDRSIASTQLKLDSGCIPTDDICESQIENNGPDTILSNVTYDVTEMSPERVAELNSLELRNLAEQVLEQIGPVPEELNVPADYIIPLFVSGQMSDCKLPDEELPDLLKSLSDTQSQNYMDKTNLANLYKLVENVLAEINLKQNIPNDALAEIITKLDSLPTEYTLPDTFTPDKNSQADIIADTEYVLPNVMKMNNVMSEKLVEMPITNEDKDTLQNMPQKHEITEITISNSTEHTLADTLIPDKNSQPDIITSIEYIVPNVIKINNEMSEKLVEMPITNEKYTLQSMPPKNEITERTISNSQNHSLPFCPLPTDDQCLVDEYLDTKHNFSASTPTTLMEILNGSISEKNVEEYHSVEESHKDNYINLEENSTDYANNLKQVQPKVCYVEENAKLNVSFCDSSIPEPENQILRPNVTVNEVSIDNQLDKYLETIDNTNETRASNSEVEIFSEFVTAEQQPPAVTDESVLFKVTSNISDVVTEKSQINNINNTQLSHESSDSSEAEMKLSCIDNNKTLEEESFVKCSNTNELTTTNKTTDFSVDLPKNLLSVQLSKSDDLIEKLDVNNGTQIESPEITTIKSIESLENYGDDSDVSDSMSNDKNTPSSSYTNNASQTDNAVIASIENLSNTQDNEEHTTENSHEINTMFESDESFEDENSYEYDLFTEFTTEQPEDYSSIEQFNDLLSSIESSDSIYEQDLSNDEVVTANKEGETISSDITETSNAVQLESTSFNNMIESTATTSQEQMNTFNDQVLTSLVNSREYYVPNDVQVVSKDGSLNTSNENISNIYDATIETADLDAISTIIPAKNDAKSQDQFNDDLSMTSVSSKEDLASDDVKAFSDDDGVITVSIENATNSRNDTSVVLDKIDPGTINDNNEAQVLVHDGQFLTSTVEDAVVEEFLLEDKPITDSVEPLPELTTINLPVYVLNEDLSKADFVEEPTLYEADIDPEIIPESYVTDSNAILDR